MSVQQHTQQLQNQTKQKTNKDDPSTVSWNDLAAGLTLSPKNSLTPDRDVMDFDYMEATARLKFYSQLSEHFINEQRGILHYKEKILKWFCITITLQLIAINFILIGVLLNLQMYLRVILDFMKYFIAGTFVELLGGLFIIIKWVYNENVYSLLDRISRLMWKESKNSSKKQSKTKSQSK